MHHSTDIGVGSSFGVRSDDGRTDNLNYSNPKAILVDIID